METNSAPHRLYIQGQGGSAIIQAATADQKVASERSQLNILDIADAHTVQTFEAPALGVTFTYWTPRQKHLGHKEFRQKTMPQAAPAAQASETYTSIEVHKISIPEVMSGDTVFWASVIYMTATRG